LRKLSIVVMAIIMVAMTIGIQNVTTKHGLLCTASTSQKITIKNGNVTTVNFGEKLDRKI
jgi:hypothetical protein